MQRLLEARRRARLVRTQIFNRLWRSPRTPEVILHLVFGDAQKPTAQWRFGAVTATILPRRQKNILHDVVGGVGAGSKFAADISRDRRKVNVQSFHIWT